MPQTRAPELHSTSDHAAAVDRLLLEREARGLKVPVIVRMVFAALVIVNLLHATQAQLAEQPWTRLVIGAFVVLCAALVGINVYLYLLLRRMRSVRTVGIVGALFDVVFICVQLLLAQLAGMKLGLSAGYIFKTEMPLVAAAMIAFNGLPLRPRYPLIVAIGATLGHLVALALTLGDDATRFNTDIKQAFETHVIDPAQIANMILMVAGVGAVVAVIASAARKTIRAAIEGELDNARLQREQLQLVMREKVQAVGRLVAGVSHELNSPLGAITSGAQTQARALERLAAHLPDGGDPGARRALDAACQTAATIEAAAARIAGTEASLRAFSHLDEADIRKVDLHAEIDNVLELIPASTRGEARVERAYGELPQLHAQARELNQALMTLLRNAFEAIDGAGCVTITTARRGDAVELQIRDTGRGIPADKLAALFEVSLSGDARVSAGFGLAAAQSIAQRHGGELSARSEEGAGATFTLRLPLR